MNSPRLYIAMLMILLFLSIPIGSIVASPVDTMIQQQTNQLQIDQVERFWSELMREYGGYFPDTETPNFMELLVPGQQKFSPVTVIKGLLAYFFHEILINGKLLATIVVLTVFSIILEAVQSAFERNSISKIAYAISYMVLIIVAINSFSLAIGYAKSAINSMIDFMIALIPLVLALLASMGNITSVTIMHPLIVFMIHALGTFIYLVVFPLLFFSTVLHIVSSLTDRYKVTHLANMLRKISATLLGVFMAIFLGVISIQGAAGAVIDGVSLRTAKYIASNFIPVVGKMFTDASNTVVGASLLVKNAIGMAGVIILIILCAFPAVKILTMALIYNLSAAVLQPLGSNPIISCLGTIGKNMIYVFAALAVVSLMFFFAISIMIAAGNISMMVR